MGTNPSRTSQSINHKRVVLPQQFPIVIRDVVDLPRTEPACVTTCTATANTIYYCH